MILSFHIHDLVEILTASGCLVFFLVILAFRTGKGAMSHCLALLFLSVGTVSFCAMCFWSPEFKPEDPILSRMVASLFILAGLLKGPALYFYVSSIPRSQYKIQTEYKVVMCVAVTVAAIAFSLGVDIEKMTQTADTISVSEFVFEGLIALCPFYYAIKCLPLLSSAEKAMKNYYSTADDLGDKLLHLLVYGFICVWGWRIFSHVFGGYVGTYIHGELPNYIGLLTRYLKFILVFGISVFSFSKAFSLIRTALTVQQKILTDKIESSARNETLNYELTLDKIEKGIVIDKLYLERNLNLERFSEKVDASVRAVSYAVNRHFSCNFFEFVNSHRVEEAKRLLVASPDTGLNDVMYMSGFSSKSSFHRVFKQHTGLSPGQFRQSNIRKPVLSPQS